MNKRIEELAEQAGIEFDDSFTLEPEPIYYLKLSDFEKFAELIVRECANICFSEAEGHSMAFGEHCGVVIKEHFGVEQ
jgi:hypothetical protein